jgi:phosphoenolpyruvate---glycerone phosphotransferase subunit DhaL
MRDRISKTELKRMFAGAAKLIQENCDALSQLDCIGGDGDHGATMLRVMEKLEAAIDPASERGTASLLKEAGWTIMGVDGGASSAILGTLIAGMGDVELGEEIDCGCIARSFDAGLRAVATRTKAKPGDKTMMDALVPAVEALGAAASAGKSIACAMSDAAAAAQMGAESTKDLVARYGRAKYLGEKTLGHPDAGATSIALLFRGFSAALAPEQEN